MKGYTTKGMTKETLDLIHNVYQEALSKSNSILEIVENFYQDLSMRDVPQEDAPSYDLFLDGLRGCIHYRQRNQLIKNMLTYFNITFMYILKWMSTTKGMDIDMHVHARLKSLESDLTKILEKALEINSAKLRENSLKNSPSTPSKGLTANIRDRFGLRGILRNELSFEESHKNIYDIFDVIAGIFAGQNRQMKKDFISWYENSNIPTAIDKAVIKEVLDIPFSVEHVKDYIETPKKNAYQTLQFTMTIQMYSNVLPGFRFEVQLRTKEMDVVAVLGTASKYKDELKELQEIFSVDDFSKVHIPGFTGYKLTDEDLDGIHRPKILFDRRIPE